MNILFYWYYIVVQAIGGGTIYATGEYRQPQSLAEYGPTADVRWVIAGQDSLSSCYAWVAADEGYYFSGFYADSLGQTLLTADDMQARLWAVTDTAKTENGIISGRDFFPALPTDTIYALFLPTAPTALDEAASSAPSASKRLSGQEVLIFHKDQTFDVLGREKVSNF